MKQIDPEQLLALMADGSLDEAQLVDVREQEEWDYYHLGEAELIPMQTIPGRLGEIARDKPVYVICAHGVRSMMVCRFLEENSVGDVINVNGGMAAVASLRGFQYD
ncbi:rhodanese-like domain-containing protein [Paenibacillus sp. MBLB4367]|uniref:rhodanese-like domain-containing protein n=1 Tax=Paenibacillus sp. MBLB4367 TaxID=3384767 RepID=UPI0039083270